jgi:glyoxylase-like metal-dependent hydrolase (beta-lactamase superfamily II)
MFGVVPKKIWQQTNPADDNNTIAMALNSLLIQVGKENILIDPGIGDKGDHKFNSIFCVDHSKSIIESLDEVGLDKSDITMVINTHLHLDHAGANTYRHDDGEIRPTFNNAKYIVQKGEWEDANHTNERTRANYLKDDYVPVMDAGQMELIEGDHEVARGVVAFRTSGHVPHNQLVMIKSGGQTAVFLGDMIPTATHLRLPFIMGYDLLPLETLKFKKELIQNALRKRWLLIFEHDPCILMGYLNMTEKGPVIEPVLKKEPVNENY